MSLNCHHVLNWSTMTRDPFQPISLQVHQPISSATLLCTGDDGRNYVFNLPSSPGVKVSQNTPERHSGARKFKPGTFRLQNHWISQPELNFLGPVS